MRASFLGSVWAAMAAMGLAAVPVAASVPVQLPVQAALTNAAGGGAPDGVYQVTFALLDGANGKQIWQEGPVAIAAKNGVLGYSLGAKTALNATILNGERWLQLQVGLDPALPAVQLQSAAFAVRAAVAEELECSGCVKAGQIDPAVLAAYAKTADLAGFAKAADLGDYVKAASLAKVAASGSYNDLGDKPKLADVASTGNFGDLLNLPAMAQLGKACGTGLYMRGIKADGSYDCGDPLNGGLPKDGLSTVSNGLLSNQFSEVAPSLKAPFDIADGLAAGVADAIEVPDFGIAQGLTVSIDLTNSDISKVRVTLYDPAGGVFKLYDQGGNGGALKATYPAPDKTVSGDLATWIGKNPKGTWSINVADLAGTVGKFDGKVNSWSITVKTLSSAKVAAKGALLLADLAKEPFPCTPSVFGAQYASSADKAVYICNGASWYPLLISALGTKEAPAVNCKDLLTKAPLTKSGVYWLDPDGIGGDAAFQAYCDMTTDGGGWTLVWSNLRGGSGKPVTNMTWNTAINTAPLFYKGPPGDNLESFSVYTGLKRWAQLGSAQIRYSWAYDFGQPVSQSYRCNYTLTGANYVINFAACTQLVGSAVPGLVSYHAGRPFATIDNDATGCAKQYSNTPWWYNACWDGSIHGGGENNGGNYQNGAHWYQSAGSFASSANGLGAGNGWIFIR